LRSRFPPALHVIDAIHYNSGGSSQGDESMPPRPFVLHEANYRQLQEHRPNVAVLPWGATEAHNYHLPHGTDVIEATALAEAAADDASRLGAKVVVLPAIPFGNNAQQLDQVATIIIRTSTAAASLGDVAHSLTTQGIDRLVLLNAHGGNDFKPLIRDIQSQYRMLIALINFWQMIPQTVNEIFDEPGDHAGELETSFLLHVRPQWVAMDQAGEGRTVPFKLGSLKKPGVWTPRPWSATHPDTGCGNPAKATADKGRRYIEAVSREIAEVLVELSKAKKGDLPYL
jgi:creatinine amidohydrolase